ncbi:MAG: disulfide bond formation protein B, partial [Aquincola tertiaricarbonis]
MASPARRADAWLGMIALVSLAAVAAALVSQHVFDMQPCPWCVLQRAIFVAIAIACAIGLVIRNGLGRGLSALLVLGLSLAGVAAALRQQLLSGPGGAFKARRADPRPAGSGSRGES